MNELRTEEEQLAAIKDWWRDNGTKLLLVLVLVGGGYFGYQGWQSSKAENAQAANELYLQLQEAVFNQGVIEGPLSQLQLERIRSVSYLADQLQDEYAGSGYAVLGALAAARAAADRDDYSQAVARLEWAKQQNKDESLAQLISYRLAVAKAAAGMAGEALALLTGESAAYAALYAEARGDIHRQAGDIDRAASEYQKALDTLLADQQSYAPSLETKLLDVTVGVASLAREQD